VAQSPRETYLSLLDQWEYNLALNSQWVLIIHDLKRIQSIVQKVQPLEAYNSNTDWSINEAIYEKLTNERVQATDEMGCFFVGNVVIPGEAYNQEEASIPNSGGNINAGVAGKRTSFSGKRIATSFRETNLDFVETVLRPWVIACSHIGFFAFQSAADGVKIPRMQLINFSRRKHAPAAPYSKTFRPIRKIYNFYNVAPIEIDTKTYDYTEDQGTPPMRQVGWVFDNYSIEYFGQ
jgi:hypothetical protein